MFNQWLNYVWFSFALYVTSSHSCVSLCFHLHSQCLSLLYVLLLPWAWAQGNKRGQLFPESACQPVATPLSPPQIPEHALFSADWSGYSFLRQSEGKECKSLTKQSALNNISSLSLGVTVRGSCCACTASQYFKKTWKRGMDLHIKGQHLTRPCLPAWTYSKWGAVGGGGSTVGGGGGKCECLRSKLTESFTAARQSLEER